MKKITIPLVVLCVFIGYAYELMPSGITMTFPFSNRTLLSNWYWFILFKDLRSVLLVWMLWINIPNRASVIKLFVAIFAVMITLVPVYFMLFYSAPFHMVAILSKMIISVVAGFLITYLTHGDSDNNNRLNY